jgi:NTP pyrophosphatase (non-canonical NTP hydrolase)
MTGQSLATTLLIVDIQAWIRHNFPDSDGCERALGLGEEVGEVQRAVLKLEQGIRGTREEWLAEISKELGDVFVKLVDVSTHYGIDLMRAVEDRWAVVRERDWQADKIGHGIGASS